MLMTSQRGVRVIMDLFSCFLSALCVFVVSRAGDEVVAAVNEHVTSQRPLSVLAIVNLFPSHLFGVIALGEELVKRGHNVTLVTTEMKGSRLLPELPESVGIQFVSAGYCSLTQQAYEKRMRQIGDYDMGLGTLHEFINETSYPLVQIGKMVDKIGTENFDIIIAEVSALPLVPYLSQKGNKVIVVSTLLPSLQANSPPWPTAALGTAQTDNLTFSERLSGPFLLLTFRLLYIATFRIVLGDSHFSFMYETHGWDLMDVHIPGIKIPLFIATVIGFEYPRTITPLTHYVGPVLMSSSPPLDPELQQWLDAKPDKSVIYISMGTSATLSPEAATALITGISAMPYSAVWSLRTSNQHILDGVTLDKSRIYISHWVAQQSLLKHKTISMAILHCGMNGIHEALYNGVPIIAAPYAADQVENAARVCHAGAGVKLTQHLNLNFSSQQVEAAIALIEAQGCREKAQKMRRLFLQAGCVKTAADLIEYYETVGWKHLVPAYAKYKWSWIQYYCVDVFLTLVAVLFVFLFCVYKTVMFVCASEWD